MERSGEPPTAVHMYGRTPSQRRPSALRDRDRGVQPEWIERTGNLAEVTVYASEAGTLVPRRLPGRAVIPTQVDRTALALARKSSC